MVLEKTFKMPFGTRHFNYNQRVWIVYESGALASYCFGRLRGKGRWVRAWVRYDIKRRAVPDIRDCDVTEEFSKGIHRKEPWDEHGFSR